MWRQVVAQSPGEHAPATEIVRYDVGWKALNTMLKSGRSLSGHERNCCFLNTRGGRFADISAAAELDLIDDGRVVVLTDWDHDGDLDFWITNRTSPQARFLRNNTDRSADFVAFKLEGRSCNRDAIGARIELELNDGTMRVGSVRSGEGYLGQSSKWVHFGMGSEEVSIRRISVRWPDGPEESIPPVESGSRYTIVQGAGVAEPWSVAPRETDLAPAAIPPAEVPEAARIVLLEPIPTPEMKFIGPNGDAEPVVSAAGRPRLVNLWATWCAPCIHELTEWKDHRSEIERAGLEVLAIAVDEESGREAADRIVAKLELPFAFGYGSVKLNAQFDVLQRAILYRQRPLPVPSSFLIDGEGNLRAIYRGPLSAEQLLADAALVRAAPEEALDAAIPYPGRWLGQPAGSSPNAIASKFAEAGFYDEAADFLAMLIDDSNPSAMFNRGNAFALLGAIRVDQGRLEESAAAFGEAIRIDPNFRLARMELADVLVKLGRSADAVSHYLTALEKRPDDPELRFKLGMAYLESGDGEQGMRELRESIALRPSPIAHTNLGNALLNEGEIPAAITEFEAAVALDPNFVPAANNLAWFMATHPDPAIRNGERAVTLAERLCEAPGARNPAHLDTLAAAYAEAGQFKNAASAAEEAIKLAKSAGDLAASREVEQRLALYQQGEPFRDRIP